MAHYHILLFAGQSNAQGYGVVSAMPTASQDSPFTEYAAPSAANFPCLWNAWADPSQIYDLWGSFVYHARSSIQGGTLIVDSGYGPALSFLRQWQDAFPSRNLAVISAVLGGSSIGQWQPGGDLNAAMLQQIAESESRLTSAGHTWEYEMFLFMHGESGAATQTEAGTYAEDLRDVLSSVRGATRASLPCLIGRIGDNWLSDAVLDDFCDGSPEELAEVRANAVLRRADQVTVGGESNCAWWDNDGLELRDTEVDPTEYHYSGPGYLAMGERAWRAYQSLLSPRRRLSIAAGGGRLLLQTGAA